MSKPPRAPSSSLIKVRANPPQQLLAHHLSSSPFSDAGLKIGDTGRVVVVVVGRKSRQGRD